MNQQQTQSNTVQY